MSHLLLLAVEEPNGWLLSSDINEIIWGTIAFVIIVALLYKFAWSAIIGALHGRTDRLAKELDDAATAKADSQAKLADVQHRIADAGNERQRILDEAARTAESLEAQLKAKADTDAAELIARAAADIEASKGQALADIHTEAAALTLGAAEAVVTRNLDEATQAQLIESYINQVGAQS